MKSNKKDLEKLWANCIKARAGFKSELSGKSGKQIGGESILNAHHILGKPNDRLRFDLDNGICITNGEHNFGVHNAGRAEEYRDRIIKVIGMKRWKYLQSLKWGKPKTDLAAVEVMLEAELAKYMPERSVHTIKRPTERKGHENH